MATYEWKAAAWTWNNHVFSLRGEFVEKSWMAPDRRAKVEAARMAEDRGGNPETVEVISIVCIKADRKGPPPWAVGTWGL
jgi:hypothetical protein